MSLQPILEPSYWRRRLAAARSLHHSIFVCGDDVWQKIEQKHREILQRHIQPDDAVFDAGCGYGRLVNMLPASHRGEYLGVDLCPDFVAMARKSHPRKQFFTCNLLEAGWDAYLANDFDWAVMISMRPMLIRNLGEEAWGRIREKVLQVADRILYLEYDVTHEGEIDELE